jgi:hypothetical protein
MLQVQKMQRLPVAGCLFWLTYATARTFLGSSRYRIAEIDRHDDIVDLSHLLQRYVGLLQPELRHSLLRLRLCPTSSFGETGMGSQR